VVQLYVQGSKEAINDSARDDYTFAGRGEKFITFYDEQAVTGKGDQLQLTLDVFDVCQLLRRGVPCLRWEWTRLKSGHSSCDWSQAERLVKGRGFLPDNTS